MGQTNDQEKILITKIGQMKDAFSSYNVVRMREALRYLSGPKLTLFIKIPFLIHINQPDFPGYVPDRPSAHGIYNFQESGFCKEGLKQSEFDPELVTAGEVEPCVLGLYHIGSLGTFTQSSQSDFDYWVIIDKTKFTEQRYYNFKKKLDQLVKYAREECDQEVTFFIMDQADIRKDCYAGFHGRETMAAPKLFLKEEFYRTFLMIAGKLPAWTIIPASPKKGTYSAMVGHLSSKDVFAPLYKDFIDLGKIEAPEDQDILKGILWHICKSKEDPVKALIKATMVLSHKFGNEGHATLLCEELKKTFPDAGIDDYRTDPYKVLFDRVIAFHEDHARDSLNLIKNAIFFRLCQYPMVTTPDPGSPKKQLLDHYIRTWNLTPSQVKKLISYPTWPESEKRLLERTFIKRLSQMYKQINEESALAYAGLDNVELRNLKILIHKTRERLNLDENKIQPSSIYLARKKFEFFLLRETKFKGWELAAYTSGGTQERKLHRSKSLLGLMGWVTENKLYNRKKARIKIDVDTMLFESRKEPVSADAMYLALQPVKPMSDDAFEYPAQWIKLMVLLVCPNLSTGFVRVEILAVNSWGEMYEDQLALDTSKDMDDRYRQIAEKLNKYQGDSLRIIFFQLAGRRDPDIVYGIKQYLEPRFLAAGPGTSREKRKRPLLDKL